LIYVTYAIYYATLFSNKEVLGPSELYTILATRIGTSGTADCSYIPFDRLPVHQLCTAFFVVHSLRLSLHPLLFTHI
jgi:hypothetical protein